jgi:hypothetical protein
MFCRNHERQRPQAHRAGSGSHSWRRSPLSRPPFARPIPAACKFPSRAVRAGPPRPPWPRLTALRAGGRSRGTKLSEGPETPRSKRAEDAAQVGVMVKGGHEVLLGGAGVCKARPGVTGKTCPHQRFRQFSCPSPAAVSAKKRWIDCKGCSRPPLPGLALNSFQSPLTCHTFAVQETLD